VVGVIGIILAVIMVVDQVDDVITYLMWSPEDWRRYFAPEVADLIVQAMPPLGWLMTSAVVGIGLGLLLFVGSIFLRRRRRNGVTLCRAWAWLAIVWAVLEIVRAISWFKGYSGELAGVPAGVWQGYAVFGIVVAMAVMMTFPLFLLFWFRRPDIRTEYEEWPG
jgi:uncharacterized membrane protein YedE/YeeE